MNDALKHFNALSLPEKQRRQMMLAGKLPLGPAQRLIWWRMKGMNFALMGKKLGGLSDESARRKYWKAIEECKAAIKPATETRAAA